AVGQDDKASWLGLPEPVVIGQGGGPEQCPGLLAQRVTDPGVGAEGRVGPQTFRIWLAVDVNGRILRIALAAVLAEGPAGRVALVTELLQVSEVDLGAGASPGQDGVHGKRRRGRLSLFI